MYKVTSAWPHQEQLKVEWNIGKRCNYDCTYCPASIHDQYSPHTPIDVLERTVDRLCALGKPLRISLTGGEPAVHPQIEDLLEYMKRKGVFWVNLTTNGTRPAQWYILNEIYFNHIVFSLHFEHDWKRVFRTINQFYDETERDFLVNVMAHHNHMDDVRFVVQRLQEVGIKYAVRRIRWTEGDHNIFDDLKYAGTDLEWLLAQESTAKPNTVIWRSPRDPQYLHANDVIKQHLNQFNGWQCNAGIESLMINWDGEVHRATCRVGGSLGNIYEGDVTLPLAPVTCTRDWCTCAADIPLTKLYDRESHQQH